MSGQKFEFVDNGDQFDETELEDLDDDAIDDYDMDAYAKSNNPIREIFDQQVKTAGLPSISLNLANAAIGSGVLALPFAFKATGYALGAIILVLFGLVADYTLNLLIKSAELVNVWNREKMASHYEILGREFAGTAGYIMVSVCTILLNFGVCAGYLIVIGDFMMPVMDWFGFAGHVLSSRWLITLIMTVLFVFPLALFRNFDHLRVTSAISVAGIFVFAVMVFVYFFVQAVNGTIPSWDLQAFKWDMDIFFATPLFTFAFACHTTMLPAYSEVKEEARHRVNRAIHAAMVMVFVSYAIIGELGYCTFGSKTEGNILNSYPENQVFINLIRMIMTAAIIFSFPMSSFPCRHALNMLVTIRKSDIDPDKKISFRRNAILITIIVGSAFVLAIFFPSIVTIFGLLGSTSLTLLSYVFPTFMYIKLKYTLKSERLTTFRNFAPFMVGLTGLTFGIISTVTIITELVATKQPNMD
jgi:sodium-coupled neutral amino acid transporter 11